MGDINAAEWCSEAHTRLLRASGSFRDDVRLLNGRPGPRGGHIETLVIDDHVGVAIDAPGSDVNARAVDDSFTNAAAGYAKAGLSRSATKVRRGVDVGVVLGAEFVKGSYLLGAERHRRRALAQATLVVVQARRSSRGFLRHVGPCPSL